MPRAKQKNWYKLDNVAKIIPSSVEGADTRVFRVACELKDDVEGHVADTYEEDYKDAYERVKAVTKASASVLKNRSSFEIFLVA